MPELCQLSQRIISMSDLMIFCSPGQPAGDVRRPDNTHKSHRPFPPSLVLPSPHTVVACSGANWFSPSSWYEAAIEVQKSVKNQHIKHGNFHTHISLSGGSP